MGWANKLMGWTTGNGVEVNSDNAMKVVDAGAAGNNYKVAAKTGTIAAAAAANAAVFAMRLNPGASPTKAYIEMVRLRWTTIAAFTTAVTQTRSLVLVRGALAAASGGTAITAAAKKDTAYGNSNFDAALGGDIRISSTGALTVTGITFETTNLAEITLGHVGAAGAFYENVYEFDPRTHPVELNPGELLAVRVGASAMDAGGTWSLGVEVAWREGSTDTEA